MISHTFYSLYCSISTVNNFSNILFLLFWCVFIEPESLCASMNRGFRNDFFRYPTVKHTCNCSKWMIGIIHFNTWLSTQFWNNIFQQIYTNSLILLLVPSSIHRTQWDHKNVSLRGNTAAFFDWRRAKDRHFRLRDSFNFILVKFSLVAISLSTHNKTVKAPSCSCCTGRYSTRGSLIQTALGFASCCTRTYTRLLDPTPRAIFPVQHSHRCFNYIYKYYVWYLWPVRSLLHTLRWY